MTAFNSQTISLGTPFCPRQDQPHSQEQNPVIRLSNLPEITDTGPFKASKRRLQPLEAFPAFISNNPRSLTLLEPHFPLTPPPGKRTAFTSTKNGILPLGSIGSIGADLHSISRARVSGYFQPNQKKKPTSSEADFRGELEVIEPVLKKTSSKDLKMESGARLKQFRNQPKDKLIKEVNTNNCFRNEVLTQLKLEGKNSRMMVSINSEITKLRRKSDFSNDSERKTPILKVLTKFSETRLCEEILRLGERNENREDLEIEIGQNCDEFDSRNEQLDKKSEGKYPKIGSSKRGEFGPFANPNNQKALELDQNSVKNESNVINKRIQYLYIKSHEKSSKQKSRSKESDFLKHKTFSRILTESKLLDKTDEKRRQLLSIASKSSQIQTPLKKNNIERNSRNLPISPMHNDSLFGPRVIPFSRQPHANYPGRFAGNHSFNREKNHAKHARKGNQSANNIPKNYENKGSVGVRTEEGLREKNFADKERNLIRKLKNEDRCCDLSRTGKSREICADRSLVNDSNRLDLSQNESKYLNPTRGDRNSEMGSNFDLYGPNSGKLSFPNFTKNGRFAVNDISRNKSDFVNNGVGVAEKMRGSQMRRERQARNQKQNGVQILASKLVDEVSLPSHGGYKGIKKSKKVQGQIGVKSDPFKFSLEISNISRQFARRHFEKSRGQISQEVVSSATDRVIMQRWVSIFVREYVLS